MFSFENGCFKITNDEITICYNLHIQKTEYGGKFYTNGIPLIFNVISPLIKSTASPHSQSEVKIVIGEMTLKTELIDGNLIYKIELSSDDAHYYVNCTTSKYNFLAATHNFLEWLEPTTIA